MAEFEKNIWAPWRMEYITGLHADGGATPACFLCDYREHPADDAANLVLWRTEKTLTLLNRFPYTGGHLLVAPLVHGADMSAIPPDVLAEATLRIRDAIRVLNAALSPQGCNVGMNLGRCAGAGLPDHLHWHIVPRWNGDTNFMYAVGDVRVIPEALERTYQKIREHARALGF